MYNNITMGDLGKMNKEEKSLLEEMLKDPEHNKPITPEVKFVDLAKEAFQFRWRKISKKYKELRKKAEERQKRTEENKVIKKILK